MSPSGVVVCPKLEELVIEIYLERFDIKDVIGIAAARAIRGMKLKSVRIINSSRTTYPQVDVLELKKHVLNVEC